LAVWAKNNRKALEEERSLTNNAVEAENSVLTRNMISKKPNLSQFMSILYNHKSDNLANEIAIKQGKMGAPMSSNMEALKKFIRANALRRLNKTLRRRSGYLYSLTTDDLAKIADQLKKTCFDVANAENIAVAALIDQAAFNQFMDKLPSDIYKAKLQRKLSVPFELSSMSSKTSDAMEKKAKNRSDGEKTIPEEQNQECPSKFKTHLSGEKIVVSSASSQILDLGMLGLEKGQKKIFDFFKPKNGLSGLPVVKEEVKPAEDENEAYEVQSAVSEDSIILNPKLQAKLKKLLTKKLTSAALNAKEIVKVAGTTSLKWKVLQDLKPKKGVSCELLDCYITLLRHEAQKIGKNDVAILEAQYLYRIMEDKNNVQIFRRVSKNIIKDIFT